MKLTRKGFQKWLRRKKPCDNVGEIHHGGQCPLAMYLRDQGWKNVAVVGRRAAYSFHEDDRQSDLGDEVFENWISNFTTNIDALTVIPMEDRITIVHQKNKQVDAATCLKTLELYPDAD